jgi:hypothetical protein
VKTWHAQTEDKLDGTVDGRHFMGLWNMSVCIVSYLPLENFFFMISGAHIRGVESSRSGVLGHGLDLAITVGFSSLHL